MTDNDALKALKDLERVKNFLGSTIVLRGYGQEEYDAVCRTLKFIEALTPSPDAGDNYTQKVEAFKAAKRFIDASQSDAGVLVRQDVYSRTSLGSGPAAKQPTPDECFFCDTPASEHRVSDNACPDNKGGFFDFQKYSKDIPSLLVSAKKQGE